MDHEDATANVVVLAGGVGGAKLADGLAQCVPADRLTIIGNTGDDFIHCGLHIAPDLDTVLYTLAGVANPTTGWGRAGETWRAMENVRAVGGPDWFNLGDRDLGVHLSRTHWLNSGISLTDVTARLCAAFDVGPRLLPMCDAPAPTLIETDEGLLPFQTWFVARRWQPAARRVVLPDSARATPAAVRAIQRASLIVIAPSNPYVSVDPILNAYPLRALIDASPATVIAVSPIIGGDAVKGPAAKMMREWGKPVSPLTVAEHYAGLIDGFVYDRQDAGALDGPVEEGLGVLETDTWMRDAADRRRLAREILTFAGV